ncbi:MAG: hypothetical protein H0X42_12290, partial [Solirubrobacterales bacterium]|nr:hypothetical protein [Solirubrobacterales bacterium]
MTRRLRGLLERPLDPATGRLVVVLGGVVCVGFAVVVGLGLLGPGATGSRGSTATMQRAGLTPVAVRPTSAAATAPPAADRETHRPPQDPQDRAGSPAARRAHREL